MQGKSENQVGCGRDEEARLRGGSGGGRKGREESMRLGKGRERWMVKVTWAWKGLHLGAWQRKRTGWWQGEIIWGREKSELDSRHAGFPV